MNSKRRIRWLAVGGLLVGAVALIGWLYAPRPLAVDEAQAGYGPIAETVQDQGSAQVRQAYIVAAPVGGRLERIGLKVGDRVAVDDVVAKIRPAPAEFLDPRTRAQAEARAASADAAVAVARADRERLASDARKAEMDLARLKTLAASGFAARQALDNAAAADRSARAAVRSAQAALRARQADADAARSALMGPDAAGSGLVDVKSPAAGYVTRVLQESERVVAPGSPLVEVSDSRGLEAVIEFLSQDAVRMREGMPAEIYDWGGPGTLPAQVRRIEPQGFTKISALGVEEQRVLVRLQLTGPPAVWSRLAPGYRVWGRVFLRRAPRALTAPLGALVRSGGGWAVFRVADGRARLVPVRVGTIADRDAEIVSGLKAGDELVLFPSDKVRDGVRVRRR